MKKLILFFIIFSAAGFVFFSCDIGTKSFSFTFQNNSDHEVTVEPDGQTSWDSFTVGSGDKVVVEITEEEIKYTYSPTETTGVDTSTEGVILFYNAYTYEFVNDSDYDIEVKPDGQDSWNGFTLRSGGSQTVTIPETEIYFQYNQANFVNADTGGGPIRFYNKTLLAIQNSSSYDLELVQWNGLFWGDDLIWDPGLGEYIHGIYSGNGYYREVSPGSDYISFWFPSGGPQYRTAELVTVYAEQQIVFTFYDSTSITERGLSQYLQDVEEAKPVIGTGTADRKAEKADADAAPEGGAAGSIEEMP